MSTYRPGTVPDDPKELASFLRSELANLQQSLNEPQSVARLQVLHAEPKKYQAGDIVLADGTNWDPGSGAGLYRRNEANSAWVFIG